MDVQNKMQPHELTKAQVKFKVFPRATVAKSLENNVSQILLPLFFMVLCTNARIF